MKLCKSGKRTQAPMPIRLKSRWVFPLVYVSIFSCIHLLLICKRTVFICPSQWEKPPETRCDQFGKYFADKITHICSSLDSSVGADLGMGFRSICLSSFDEQLSTTIFQTNGCDSWEKNPPPLSILAGKSAWPKFNKLLLAVVNRSQQKGLFP